LVAYTENHSGEVYRMLNLSTNSIIISRKIVWLKKSYKGWTSTKQSTFYEEQENELRSGLKGLENDESIDKIVDGEEDKSDTKVYRALKKLESAFNPHAKKAIDDYNHGREISLEQVNFALFTTIVIKEPSSCKEAINYAEKKVRFALKEAIDKELNEMTKRGA
jgi:hypothetical protein